MSKYTNPGHLDNFVSNKDNRFAIVDCAFDAVNGMSYWEVASGKTEEEAIERFYSRFMLRASIDREMMLTAQKRESLVMQKIEFSSRKLIADKLFLIV